MISLPNKNENHFGRVKQLMFIMNEYKWSVNYAFLGHNLKLGKELYLLKVSLVFKLIESSIATPSYFFTFFFWSVNYTNMVYILCVTFWKCQDRQTLCGIYLVLTYTERLSRLYFSSVSAGQ